MAEFPHGWASYQYAEFVPFTDDALRGTLLIAKWFGDLEKHELKGPDHDYRDRERYRGGRLPSGQPTVTELRNASPPRIFPWIPVAVTIIPGSLSVL